MEELFLDREKILSTDSTKSFEDWIKVNYDEDIFNRIESSSNKFTNTIMYSLAVLILTVALLTKPIVDAVLGLNELTVYGACGLCAVAITISVIMPILGYKWALYRAGEEWCTYRKLWMRAKKSYEHAQKRLNSFMKRC